ncbi:phosphate/phosphite/phosphonate ABC transporter substrate-binding protein [Acuticoccus sediminis]|uniref:phosphate/phosphite/phosphonate ABC transporter substrate-binding protein n=1 Tax=Acuticoccus sediminis TaxID=2184697 RepID=UPI001CFCBE8C|nr:PhnD/SsuA/transferrin family substrate-binding protein [Acuticoccus sediminis]
MTATHPAPGGAQTASLGMYDAPWVSAANDRIWTAVALRLRDAGVPDVPAVLDRDRSHDAIWHDPNLLLAQTCGFPLVTSLAGVVRPIAAPVYAWPGCDGPRHVSVIVVREEAPARSLADVAGTRAAMNGRDSNTGMNLFRHALAPLAGGKPMFASVQETGGHVASLTAVQQGEADVAAVDAVTFAIAARHRPDLVDGLRILAETAPSPSLPFVTRGDADPVLRVQLFHALRGAVADPAVADARAAIGLVDVVPVTVDDYAIVARYAAEAAALGYPELA